MSAGDAGAYDVVVTGDCGEVTSAPAPITVIDAPQIVTAPSGADVCVGDPISLSVSATGDSLSYQWKKNGVNIGGATSSSLSIASAATGDAGSYTVDVSNSCGTVTSGAAAVSVTEAPQIVTGPSGADVCVGDPISLSVSATGDSLSYQWKKNGVNIGGATSSSLSIASAVAGDAGSYTVDVSNSCGTVTSGAAAVSVTEAPQIVTGPAGATLCVGDEINLSVAATGDSLSYQWKKNGVNIGGATTSSLVIPTESTADAGSYTVDVSNSCGSVASAAAVITMIEAPQIVSGPSGATLCVGDEISLSVAATGDSLSYQWKKNGVNIGGATSSSLIIAATVAGDAGSYTVEVSNPCGSLTSAAAVIVLATPVSIDTNPQSLSVCVGDEASFTVGASGDSLTYQWRKDGSPIGGANGSSYTIAAATAGDLGNYDVVVSGACGDSVTSAVAVLSLGSPPTIDVQPIGAEICEGDALALSVTASGTDLTYQWRLNGNPIAGANASSYDLAVASLADAGSYDVVVSNGCGPTASDAAIVILNSLPVILASPASQTLCEGLDAVLRVTLSGSEDATYQWKKDGVDIPGATTDRIAIAGATAADDGAYSVVVSNDCGSVEAEEATLTVNLAPAIDTQPEDAIICEGQALELSVAASGFSPLSYQWKKDGEDIPGANSASYGVPVSAAGDAGSYTCVVTNPCGDEMSSAATVTVQALPEILSGPESATICEGADVTFSVSASGTDLTYQWRHLGVDFDGATASSLTIDPVLSESAGEYEVVVTSSCGASVVSAPATLTVTPLPVITAEPQDVAACVGTTVALSVEADSALSYQWRLDGVDIPGATGATYEIAAFAVTDAGGYDVVVDGECGTVTSRVATLSEETECGEEFIRADCNGDGRVDLSDSIASLLYLFRGTNAPECMKACDANDDGSYDVGDPIFTLNFIFRGLAAPPAPGFEQCGADPTADSLTCDFYACP